MNFPKKKRKEEIPKVKIFLNPLKSLYYAKMSFLALINYSLHIKEKLIFSILSINPEEEFYESDSGNDELYDEKNVITANSFNKNLNIKKKNVF